MILLPGAGVAGNLRFIPADKTATQKSGRYERCYFKSLLLLSN
ncbi:Uncharacterised protein [Morganella morganii]|nr:Uncharacterised protein [Morganella morganii]